MSAAQEALLAAMGLRTPGAELAAQTAAALRALREESGLSQREVAAAMGTSQAQVVRIENAQVLGLSLRSVAEYAAACGTTATITLTADTPT